MGVQKIRIRNSRCSKISLCSDGKGKGTADNRVVEAELEDDSDGFDSTEPSCELGMLEGQPCSIPYELYDLPDLKEILSLDTWNSCLTEDERFFLTAYLPDMDQHTFCLTMKEIFDGSNIYFGNPLDMFFIRLKGGYYPPKVSSYREGLQFLQRKMYYHSLRSYHDRMVKMLVDMRRIWDQCDISLDVGERISMWTERRSQRCMLDLNKFPKDDHLLNDEFNLHSKGVMSVESKRAVDNFPSLPFNGTKFVAPNCRAKGVLKVKASGNGSFQNLNPKILTGDTLVQSQSVAKGVLKIVPKIPSTHLEQSELVLRGAQSTFTNRTQGLQDFEFSSLPASFQFGDAKGLYESAFQSQKVDGSRIQAMLDQPPCLLNQQESTMRTNNHLKSYTRKMKMEMDSSLDDNGISVLGKHRLFGGSLGSGPDKEYKFMDPMASRKYPFSGENLWPDLVTGTRDFSLKSLESFPFDIQYHGGEQRMATMKEEHMGNHPGTAKVVPRISDVGIGMQEKVVSSSSEHVKGNESVLPLTYKRRKALAKVNSLDFGKSLTAEADSRNVIQNESNQHLGERAKVVKIKFTGWKDEPLNKDIK